MNELIFKTFNLLASKQFQLQNIRQLLCEQVQFVPYQAYLHFLDEDANSIDLFCLMNVLGKQRNEKAMESILKFYSHNQIKLDFDHFQIIVIARENFLLKKLTRERRFDQDVTLPQYIINYLIKLWKIEEQLHSELNQLRNHATVKHINFIEQLKTGKIVNEQLLKEKYFEKVQHSCQQCPLINYQMAVRYIKRGNVEDDMLFETFSSFFVSKNCTTIQNYLANKDFQLKKTKKSLKKPNPYIHKQFHKLNPAKTQCHSFCFRQIKSVQEHFRRTNNMPSTPKLNNKIKKFSKQLESQLVRFFKELKKVIKVTAQIQRFKYNLLQNYNCQFSGFFRQITKNISIVPSELQHYLKSVGITVDLSDLFVLFKRHGDPITGKITAKHFTRIFTHRQQMQKDEYDPVSPEFRKAVIACLLKQINLQLKIERIKHELSQQVQFRDIFDCLDFDKKGKVSRTDFQVCIKNIAKQQLSSQETEIFWTRMGRSINEYIDYDNFMWAMLPQTRKRPLTTKKIKY